MARTSEVVKLKKRMNINIGIVILSILFLYLLISFYLFLTKPHLAVHEITLGSNKINTTATAMILRTEETVYNTRAGYANYYLRDGARVAKGERIYSVNDDSSIYDLLHGSQDTLALSGEDIVRMKHKITVYRRQYSDSNFSDIYEEKEDFLSFYLQSLDNSLLDTIQGTLMGNGTTNSFSTYYAAKSGILTYYSDAYDGMTAETATAACFEGADLFSVDRLRTGTILGAGSPVYKLVTSDTWQLLFLLTKEQYQALSGRDKLTFTIASTQETYTKAVSFYERDGAFFALVTMDRYLNSYLNERFVTAELSVSAEEGLKVPKSAVLTKSYYRIPESYVTHGGNQDETTLGITVEQYDKDTAQMTYVFSPITVFYEEDGSYYVDANDFDSASYIVQLGTKGTDTGVRTMLYTFITELEGVYNVNKGYAVFRRIERLTENEEYLIVKENTPGGLAVYDHIILDATTASDAVIIN